MKLAAGLNGIDDVADAERDGGDVDRPIGQRQPSRVSTRDANARRQRRLLNLATSQPEHLRREIDADHVARVTAPRCRRLDGQIGRARAHVEHALATRELQFADGVPPPAAVEAGAQQVIERGHIGGRSRRTFARCVRALSTGWRVSPGGHSPFQAGNRCCSNPSALRIFPATNAARSSMVDGCW